MIEKNSKSERVILVKPEPFFMRLDPEITDDDIQDILDDRGIGECGWEEKDEKALQKACGNATAPSIEDLRNDP